MPPEHPPVAIAPPPRARAPLGRAGVSMAEVLVVLTIIGIALSIGAPRVNLSPSRTEAAVQSVASTLMAAQRAAVVRQHNVVVAFDATQGLVRVHMDPNNNGTIDAGEQVTSEPLGRNMTYGRGGAAVLTQLGTANVSFTARQGGLPAVTFNRGGSASEEGGAYLTSTVGVAAQRPSRAVIVDRATGRTAVWKYVAPTWQRKF
ncbi:pilus assembly FimT family protein [Longimicrobium terrae]|uniref:Type II secretion system protein H n=1 Tax=Longimicrobium terrae TaxID=1639882 RepID=A0A841H1T3_9BACT|nr:type II secretion system protein [Longimicrobium terrae]MBB4637556.1 prepilin-type N-terminal cleavage/methylation domain-containing protein [Longimicrobium terrae]MBB6071953.1 prepilin-type N-terminal cleavage/methylation domain-containing protein [Longimicrobium terrae]NNC30499.1 prepilin-type N-terminal cleavage/methylation domain-containing protein [Longimicrobium terrae]